MHEDVGGLVSHAYGPSACEDLFCPQGKVENNTTKPGKLRPICVFSTWWRAWSSWMKSKQLSLLQSLLPDWIKAKPGSSGAEVAAATGSLDFSHCFDCIDLELVELAVGGAIPSPFKPWFSLLIGQWKQAARSRRTSRSSQVTGSLFQSFSQLPQADGAFKIQCLLSVPFLFQLRTQQQQLQLLTYTHGTYPNIYMYRCNTIRRLAVDPHISTVTFLIKCGRLCLCFVLVLFPNVKLWFILVWQSFFFLFEFWNPIISYFWILFFLNSFKKKYL